MPARPSVVSAEFIVHTINANSIFWMSVHQIAVVVEALSGLGASIAYDEERHRVILNSDTPIGRQYADMAAKRWHEAYEAEKKRISRGDTQSEKSMRFLHTYTDANGAAATAESTVSRAGPRSLKVYELRNDGSLVETKFAEFQLTQKNDSHGGNND